MKRIRKYLDNGDIDGLEKLPNILTDSVRERIVTAARALQVI
jgi:hypothetical protein